MILEGELWDEWGRQMERLMRLAATSLPNRCSGGKPFQRPGAVWLPAVEETVVETAGLPLPEFDGAGRNPIAAPEVGQGDLALEKFALHLFQFLQQQLAGAKD